MTIEELVFDVKKFINDSFFRIDLWFVKKDELLEYKPKSGGWSNKEILEHIALTNHFLLKLIKKGTDKALRNINNLDLQTELLAYDCNRKDLEEISIHKSFIWLRPSHMQPTGKKTMNEIHSQLKNQRIECLEYLEKLKNGEGVLYKTTMTVNGLGKISVYDYLAFLSHHITRHVSQMNNNDAEFNESTKTSIPAPHFKYVWLFLDTGEFSNSWDEETHKLVDEQMIQSAKERNVKLIKYQCLTDDTFEFYRMMRLK